MIITNAFIDDHDNIYVTDDNAILYKFNEHRIYEPFIKRISNVKNCYLSNGIYCVHSDKKVMMFDIILSSLKVTDCYFDNVEKICYHSQSDIVLKLLKGDILANSVLDTHPECKISLIKCIYDHYKNQFFNNEIMHFNDMKIVDNMLITWTKKDGDNGYISLFSIKPRNIKVITICSGTRICYDNTVLIGDITLYHNREKLDCIISESFYFECINTKIFNSCGIFCYFERKNTGMNIFHCIAYINNVEVIEKMRKLTRGYESTIIPFTNLTIVTSWEIDHNVNITINNGKTMQLIRINDEFFYYEENIMTFDKLKIRCDKIDFDSIFTIEETKTGDDLVIDVYKDKPVIDQLLPIVCNIYRFNRSMSFGFHQVDSMHRIISFGDGVSRQVFCQLKRELDEALKIDFDGIIDSDDKAFDMGRLIYFCCQEGYGRFKYIHPYLFYLFASERDYEDLIKLTKGKDAKSLINLYRSYKDNPQSLIDLDLGLKDANDYIKYLFTEGTSDKIINMYEKIYEGFDYFASREQLYSFSKYLSFYRRVHQLINDGVFNAEIEFKPKDIQVNKMTFCIFKEMFMGIFYKLSNEQILIFNENITGAENFGGIITVVVACPTPYITISNDDIYSDSDSEQEDLSNNLSENISDNQEPLSSQQPSYQISTCDAELTISIEPTENNIRKLLELLCMPDNHMIN